MTIKQYGGVFGRNPTFNDVTIEGELTFNGDIDIDSDLKIDGNLDVIGSSTLASLSATTGAFSNNVIIGDYALTDIRLSEVRTNKALFSINADGATNGNGTTISYSWANGGQGPLKFNNAAGEVARFTTNGDLAFVSGKGIDFSATAGTGTSELFDDYEEGVHEAALVDVGAGATIAVSYNRLNYVKVGRLVQITGEVIISGITGTPSGGITVSLPFTGANSSERSANARCYVAMSSLTGSPTGFGNGYITSDGTTMALQTETAYAYGSITSNIQVGTKFVFNFSYQSA